MEYGAYNLDKIIDENSKFVYHVCSKYNNYPDKEDLHQVGKMALIDAYKNYDPKYNVKFSTYAYPYIVGEVNKYIRENKNIKVSKDLIKLGRKINEYIDKHYEVRGYYPSTFDISSMLGIKEEKVVMALDLCKEVKSLDEAINNDEKKITLLDVTKSKDTLSKDQILDLKEAFKYLSKEEKMLLINRYYNDLTQSEIAKIMGVNQVYVSRLEKKALEKMRNKLVQ